MFDFFDDLPPVNTSGGPRQPIPMPSVSPYMQASAPQPGMPMMRGPSADPSLPAMNAPRRPSLLERLFPTPAAFEGLMSKEELSNARRQGLLRFGSGMLADSGWYPKYGGPTLGQSIGKSFEGAQDAYNGAIDRTYSTTQAGMGMRAQQQKQALRDQIAKQFPAAPGETREQTMRRMESISAALIQGGDTEAASKIAEVLKAMHAGGNGEYQATQLGDQVTTFDPKRGYFDASKGLPPSDPRAWSFSVARHKLPEQIAEDNANRELRKLSLEDARAGRQDNMAQRDRTAFDSRVKPLRERAQSLNQAIRTLTDGQGNPYLTTSSIANFIQAADQKAQIRWQLLNYFKNNINSSITGWAEIKANLLTKGYYPKEVYVKLINHLQNLKAMTRDEYDRARNFELKRNPRLDKWLSDSDVWYKDALDSTPSDSEGSSAQPTNFFASPPPAGNPSSFARPPR